MEDHDITRIAITVCMLFLCTSNNESDNEFRKTIPFTIAIIHLTCLAQFLVLRKHSNVMAVTNKGSKGGGDGFNDCQSQGAQICQNTIHGNEQR